MSVFERRSGMPVPVAELAAWHTRRGSFERLLPPWERVNVLARRGGVAVGDGLTMSTPVAPGIRRRWVAEIVESAPGTGFVDRQVAGPFRSWRHEHRFLADGDEASVLEDVVTYELPGEGWLDALAEPAVRRRLARMFAFRHRRTRDDLRRLAERRGEPRLTVAVTGAGGLVGGTLSAFLTAGGHRVLRLTRGRPAGADQVYWDPMRGEIDASALEGVDAVVHLAGETIAGLWTAGKREGILRSRVRGTELIARTAAGLRRPPQVVVSASAVGAYGDTGDVTVNEEAPLGTGFLAEVCGAWEAGLGPARSAGLRTVSTRFGIVLSGAGGLLATMLPAFRAGAAARLGDGRQWMSWVALDDVVGALYVALFDGRLSGAVNVVAPTPVSNREFTATLARVLRRPAVLAAPRVVLERALGDMAREMLLVSQRVEPARLAAAGFTFLFPTLEEAVRFELGRMRDA